MTKKIPIVAIIGRTNVGKSTLFNAIVGRRVAVVEDTPGVTRDRNYALVNRFGKPFTLVDTGGIVGEEDNSLHRVVRQQAEFAIEEADLILAIFDGKNGLHPLDQTVLDVLRRTNKPVVWVINKCEKKSAEEQAVEFYSLGIDSISTVSAAHYRGINELGKTIQSMIQDEEEESSEVSSTQDPTIRVAIVGRPNVGKSTLLNKLTDSERVVASDIPGTTRDSIEVDIVRDGQRFTIVDTAGLRRKSKVGRVSVERFANIRALNALAVCDVAVLLIDTSDGVPSDQDIRIATLIHERGRSFVIAINKWDLIEKDHRTAKDYEDMVRNTFQFAQYAPIVFLSAKTGKRCLNLFDQIRRVYEAAKVSIEQEPLEQALFSAVRRNQPPIYHGRPIKISAIYQVGGSPPTFEVWISATRGMTESYERYLTRELRAAFPFVGSDIRLRFRKKTRRAEKLEAESIASEVPSEMEVIEEWDL